MRRLKCRIFKVSISFRFNWVIFSALTFCEEMNLKLRHCIYRKYFCDIHRLLFFRFPLTNRYSIDRSKDPGRRFIVTPDCEVKVKRGLDGETLDREALAGLPEPMYEVHVLAKDKGKTVNLC